jgi:hypothetical protein
LQDGHAGGWALKSAIRIILKKADLHFLMTC